MSNSLSHLTNRFRAPYPKMVKYLLILFLLSILCQVLVLLIIKFTPIDPLHEISLDTASSKYGPLIVLFYTIFAGPIIEEFSYRGYLLYIPSLIALSVGLITIQAITVYITLFNTTKVDDLVVSVALGIILLVVTSLSYFLIRKDESTDQKIKKFWEAYPKGLFIFSIILFGSVHAFNFIDLTPGQLLILPLIIGPQLICGYFLGRMRIEYGLLWSIQLHILINSIHFVPLYFLG